MSKELERLEEEKLRLIKKLEDNDSIFDRQYINLKIENINLQMKVYNLMQPAVQKLMLSSPKILVIQNDKTIGYIENELLEKAEKYDELTTPPTEQEVCEALGEYMGEEIIYIHYDDELNMTNLLYAEGRPIAYTNKVKSAVGIIKELVITMPLPPRLITMIGKFYEGKVKE